MFTGDRRGDRICRIDDLRPPLAPPYDGGLPLRLATLKGPTRRLVLDLEWRC